MKAQRNIPVQSSIDPRKKSGKAYAATGFPSFLKLVGYKNTVSADKKSTPVVLGQPNLNKRKVHVDCQYIPICSTQPMIAAK